MAKNAQTIIISGFGGQGIMLFGRLLAEAGLRKDLAVSWIPSYGPEMRGGTANCTAILSETPIGSPVVADPSIIICFNQPSMEKFLPTLKPGGMCFYDSSLIPTFNVKRDDVEIFAVPATEIADKIGNTKLANMVMTGAYLAKTDMLDLDIVMKALTDTLPKRRHNLLPLNEEALKSGKEFLA
jgi:2-oxoglutarate ferredoxin oxidoreductase subunit gamma